MAIQFRELDVVSERQRLLIAVRIVEILLYVVGIGFANFDVIVQECNRATCSNGENSIQEEDAVDQGCIRQ